MIDPFVYNLEMYLNEYLSVVSEKHSAVKKGKYDEASKLRDKERHYEDIGYDFIFNIELLKNILTPHIRDIVPMELFVN